MHVIQDNAKVAGDLIIVTNNTTKFKYINSILFIYFLNHINFSRTHIYQWKLKKVIRLKRVLFRYTDKLNTYILFITSIASRRSSTNSLFVQVPSVHHLTGNSLILDFNLISQHKNRIFSCKKLSKGRSRSKSYNEIWKTNNDYTIESTRK